jgi:hypothetical protein
MKLRRWLPRLMLGVPLFTYGWSMACGDVTSDVITRAADLPSLTCETECAGATPRCDVASGLCVECLEALDCGQGQACARPSGRCVTGCNELEPCSSDQPVCEVETGLCGPCVEDPDCPDDTPYCQPSGACVECRTRDDCDDSDEPYCDASGLCVECLMDGHCNDSDEACSVVLSVCARPCVPDARDCDSDHPVCDPALGFCVECQTDLECDIDEVCRSSECHDD